MINLLAAGRSEFHEAEIRVVDIKRQVSRFVDITRSDRPVLVTAVTLYVGVFLVVALYVATSGAEDGSLLKSIHTEIGLQNDRSMAEIFGYGLAFLASVLFFVAFIETDSLPVLFLSVFMGFIWFDDSSSYHERFGRYLGKTFDLPTMPGLRLQDTGEVLAWAIAATILSVLFIFAFSRRRGGDLGVLIVASLGIIILLLCGIVADVLHVMATKKYEPFVGVLEDGGEMIGITYLAIVALSLARNGSVFYNVGRSNVN